MSEIPDGEYQYLVSLLKRQTEALEKIARELYLLGMNK
jgi:hypothetical protein